MTIYVPSYLRPLSRVRTGNHSRIDEKTEQVQTITYAGRDILSFEQHETVNLWVNEQAYHGKHVVDSDREIRVEKTVDFPERHWWIISTGVLEQLDPPLREHADIFDLLIALNLCTDEPVFFSQSPGDVVGGAYQYEDSGLTYRNDLSLGNIGQAVLGIGEIPEEVTVDGDVPAVYERVRAFRSQRLSTDEEVDVRVALHMYDDALSSDIWTAATNLYFACENVLSSGRDTDTDQRIADRTVLSAEDAYSWRKLVNRLKHPDTGESIEGFLDQDSLSVPSPQRMKQAANTVLKTKMSELGE